MAETVSHEPAAMPRAGGWCFSSLLLFTHEDLRCVHPDDLPSVREKYPLGWQLLCFRYDGRQAEYDVLDDGELRARVRGAYIEPIPAPRFRRGERVFAHPEAGGRGGPAGVLAPEAWAGVLLARLRREGVRAVVLRERPGSVKHRRTSGYTGPRRR